MNSRLIERWMPVNQVSTEAIRERAGAVPNPAPISYTFGGLAAPSHHLESWPETGAVPASFLGSPWVHGLTITL